MAGETYIVCDRCMPEILRAVQKIHELEAEIRTLKSLKTSGASPTSLQWDEALERLAGK